VGSSGSGSACESLGIGLGKIPFGGRTSAFALGSPARRVQEVSDGSRWMLRFAEGEELPDALAAFARRHAVRAAAVPMGIGQLTRAKLGFWNGSEYESREWTTPVELVSMSGSIAEADGAPSIHLHATLGLQDHAAAAGHVMSGRVGLLLEMLVVPFPERTFARPMDEAVGLRRLDLGTPEQR
jgi:predicted DNA-binding protein with PD1-like motif